MERMIKRSLSLLLAFVMVFIAIAPITTDTAFAATSSFARLAQKDEYATSEDVARAFMKEKKISKLNSIIIATGENYADALSASYLANTANCPILLSKNSKLSNTVKFINSKVKKGGTVYIIGGTDALGRNFDTKLKTDYEVVRIGGKDRYGTNLLVLKKGDELYKKNKGGAARRVVVVSGRNFADAVTAGSLGLPILIVDKNLKSAQKDYLKNRAASKYFIFGGKNAVSKSVEKAVKKYGEAARFFGNDRFETAVAVAKKFFGSKSKEAIVVNGGKFAYGIIAGPLAQAKKCPILLNTPKNIAQAWNYEIRFKTKKTTVIGSKELVATGTIATGSKLKEGWNNYLDGFVYVLPDRRIVKEPFTMEGGDVKPTTGGFISTKNSGPAMRRADSASYGTAIVIHINSQMLDFAKDGKIVFSTPIVTGNEKDNNHTPRGNFRVTGKARNTYLVGPGYRSFVKYWVPFIGRSYGMHDADWRNKFGGDIYLTRGSRGCVNIPPEVMPAFYDMVWVGLRVIVKQK